MGAVTRRTLSDRPEGTRRHSPDYWLLVTASMLLAIGLIVVYAISPGLAVENSVSGSFFVTRQIIAILLGAVIFVFTSRIPLDIWRKAGKPLLIGAAGATLFALVLPVNVQYPAHRWIRLGSFSFQSVELLKFALLIMLSSFLADRIRKGTIKDVKKTLKPLGIALLIIGIVVAYIQSDLGSTGVILAMVTAIVFIAGVPMPVKRILLIGGALIICLALLVSAFPYRRARLEAFMNPQANCSTISYQECQALIAVGSGGMVGLGLGKSVQAFGYLPEAQNDSIFAIYAEKFGFIGVCILLGIMLTFFSRIKRIMELAPDDFTRLVATGILAWLGVQTFINVGAMLGVLPLKGITLPFISYGGTSVLMVMAAVGLLFNISRYTLYSVPRESEGVSGRGGYEDSSDRRRVRGAYHPSPSSRA